MDELRRDNVTRWTLALSAVVLTLSGCSNLASNEEAADRIAAAAAQRSVRFQGMHDDAEVKLVEAASSVSKSLDQLANIERAMYPHLQLPQPENPAAIGMQHIASVDWNGPIEPLVQKIADASHYRLRVLGHKPGVPVIVSVTQKNKPLADILRDATYQSVKRANIVVYPGSHVIEMRYIR